MLVLLAALSAAAFASAYHSYGLNLQCHTEGSQPRFAAHSRVEAE